MEKQENKSNYSDFIELLNFIEEKLNEEETEKSRYIQKLREEKGDFFVYGTDGETIITL